MSITSNSSPIRVVPRMRMGIAAALRLRVFGFAALACLFAGGVASAASETVPPAAPATVAPPAQAISYRVGPGDVLAILVYAGGEKQDDLTTTVSAAGVITCPLVGDLKVAGLTPAEISAQLRDSLARDYFVEPQVLVSVREYVGKIYLIGEVKHPGVYSIQDRLTVLNACILAGGFTDFASPGRALVTRVKGGVTHVIKINLAKVMHGKAEDMALETGDRIDVPSRRF